MPALHCSTAEQEHHQWSPGRPWQTLADTLRRIWGAFHSMAAQQLPGGNWATVPIEPAGTEWYALAADGGNPVRYLKTVDPGADGYEVFGASGLGTAGGAVVHYLFQRCEELHTQSIRLLNLAAAAACLCTAESRPAGDPGSLAGRVREPGPPFIRAIHPTPKQRRSATEKLAFRIGVPECL